MSATRSRALVWIDTRRALIVSGPQAIALVASDIPARHRATGRVRHDSRVRHGGGGPAGGAADARPLQHRRRFLDRVVERLAGVVTVDVIGPGELPIHLAERIRETDREHARRRALRLHRAGRFTRRQLVASWRSLGGLPLRRVALGAWRWDGRTAGPWRLWRKRRQRRDTTPPIEETQP